MSAPTTQTPEDYKAAQRRSVMEYAYVKDGKYYTVNDRGNLTATTLGAVLPDGTKVQAMTPEYQKMADQAAAVAMMYNKVLALEPAQRGIVARILQTRDGALDGLNAQGMEALEEMRRSSEQLLGIKVPTVNEFVRQIPVVGTAIRAYNGFALVPNAIGNLITAVGATLDQLGGSELSIDNARAIGIAFASGREAAAAGRPLDPQAGDFFHGLFSRYFGDYAGAGLAWLLDVALGFAEMVPGIGPWIQKQGWRSNMSLAQHIEAFSRGSDNTATADAMLKLPEIGHKPTTETAPLLAYGGLVRTPSGQQAIVTPADGNHSGPVLTKPDGTQVGATTPPPPAKNANPARPDAAPASASVVSVSAGTPADTAPAQTPEAAQQQRDRAHKPGFIPRAGDAIGNSFETTIDAAGTAGPVWSGIGIWSGLQTARGVAEGIGRQWVDGPADRATKLTNRVNTLQEKITAAEANPKTSNWQVWKRSEKSVAGLREEMAGVKTQAVANGQLAAAREASAGAFTEGAGTTLKTINQNSAWPTWMKRIWNAPRGVGRVLVGDPVGHVFEGAYHMGERAVGGMVKGVSKIPVVGETIAAGVAALAPKLAAAGPIPVVGAVLGGAVDTVHGVSAALQGDGVQATSDAGKVVGGVAGATSALGFYGTIVAAFSAGATGAELGAEGGAGAGLLAGGVGALPGGIIGAAGGAIIGTGGYFIGRWAFGHAATDVANATSYMFGHRPASPPAAAPGDRTPPAPVADPDTSRLMSQNGGKSSVQTADAGLHAAATGTDTQQAGLTLAQAKTSLNTPLGADGNPLPGGAMVAAKSTQLELS